MALHTVPEIVTVTGKHNECATTSAIREIFPFHRLCHYRLRPFTMSDLSNCFTRSDLVWLELPHKWFPQQFGESSKFFDTILRRAQCPVVFVLHKPLSSPLLRIKWFKEFLDSLNLSKCCTCCSGANTHCLVYMFSRGLVFEDRTCAQRVPSSIVTGVQELVVWKTFIFLKI